MPSSAPVSFNLSTTMVYDTNDTVHYYIASIKSLPPHCMLVNNILQLLVIIFIIFIIIRLKRCFASGESCKYSKGQKNGFSPMGEGSGERHRPSPENFSILSLKMRLLVHSGRYSCSSLFILPSWTV